MSRSERAKGMAGEQAVARIFREAGRRVERLQQQQGGMCDMIVDDLYYVDTKHHERAQVTQWLGQAERQSPPGTVPVVAFRRNAAPKRMHAKESVEKRDWRTRYERGEWYVSLPLSDFVGLVS